MAVPALLNLARMTTATTGTGTITLGAAVSSFLTFAAAGAVNGATYRYAIADGAAREWGTGVYTSSGTTLTRVLGGSTTGSLLNLSGSAQVFITPMSEDFLQTAGIGARDASGGWHGRTLTAATNGGLAVTDGDGVSGNPTLSFGDYLPSATGAVARSVVGKLGDVISICDFGGAGDGVTDNSAALTAAFAALPATGGTVYIPAGVYVFSTAVSVTLPDVYYGLALVGAGPGATILRFGNTDGVIFYYTNRFNTVLIQGITFTTTVGSTHSAVSLLNLHPWAVGVNSIDMNTILDCSFRGDSGEIGVEYWLYCVRMVGVSCVNIARCNFCGGYTDTMKGVGIGFSGESATTQPGGAGIGTPAVMLNVTMCQFTFNSIALYFGGADGSVQGLTVTQCNMQACKYGIYVPEDTNGVDQLLIQCNYINCYILGIFCAMTTEAPGNTIITGNYFNAYQIGSHNIRILNYDGIIISNNHFLAFVNPIADADTIAIYLGARTSSGAGGSICGNTIRGYTAGIFLDTTATQLRIANNQTSGCTSPIANYVPTSNTIVDNAGVNPVGVSALSPGASPWTYTSGAYYETIYISASTGISAVTQRGSSILPAALAANVPFTIHAGPHDAIVITYTGTLHANTMVH
jgi:hypothetical protein